MKVLIVDTSPSMGGSIRSGAELIKGLAAAGDEVAVTASRHDLFRELVGDLARYYNVEWEGFENLFATKREATKIRIPVITQLMELGRLQKLISPYLVAALEDFKPDIVHLNQFNMYSRLTLEAAKKAGVPCVMHGREIRLYGRSELRLLNLTKRCICVSTEEMRCLARQSGASEDKFSIAFNGVDVEAFRVGRNKDARKKYDLPEEAKLACMLGRVIPWKGQDVAIEAWATVVKSVPGAVLAVVGYGREDYLKTCRDKVERLDLGDSVKFIGGLDDVRGLLAASDLLVHASRYANPKYGQVEAFGRVVIEGMATGLPVVATRAGGVIDIVEDGVSGALVNPGDPDDMAEAVIGYLNDAKKSAQTGLAARKRVEEKFTSEMTTQNIRSIYQSVVEKR